MIVIIPCGQKKRNYSCKAKDMYIGAYFKTCLQYARKFCKDDAIYILSAKYGLLSLQDIISPYEKKLGNIGCISVLEVKEQAISRKIIDEECIILGGKLYRNYCKAIWRKYKIPMDGLKDMRFGKAMQWMKAQL